MPRRARALPENLLAHLELADLILHAGDLVIEALIHELSAYAPVRAVRGNLDPPDLDLPETLEFDFGHSHIPFLEDEDGFMLLNPGSPTDKRRQPRHTFALLHAEEGRVRAEILSL